MNPWERLSAIESEIRGAVTTGAYEEATLQLSGYSKQLETELQNSSFRGDQLAEEMVHATQFLDWIFRMVSAARAHHSAQVTELLSLSRYRCAEPQVHSWRFEG